MGVPTPGSGLGRDFDLWEYEYDEHETEDYYFTLDVTTNKLIAPKNKQKRTKTSSQAEQADEAVDPELRSEAAAQKSNTEEERTLLPSPTSGKEARLHVIGLHTDSPLIKLNDSFYTCQWSTDLGSQFYVTRRGVFSDPLRGGRVLDVIGLSRARLIGRPATLHRRADRQPDSAQGNAIAPAFEAGYDEFRAGSDRITPAQTPGDIGTNRLPTQQERFAEVQETTSDPELKAKASFLQRLSAIKASRGETDRVPLYGVKNYKIPSNTTEIRERARLADEAQGQYAPPVKRRRGPNKKKTEKGSETRAGDVHDGSKDVNPSKLPPATLSERRSYVGSELPIDPAIQKPVPGPPAQSPAEPEPA